LADSAQLHAVVVDLETEARGVWDRQLIQTVIFEIEEFVAAEAHEVVVELETRVEACDTSWVTGPGDHTDFGEVIEGPVNGGARDAWEAVFDGVKDLIDRWVIIEVEDRFEDYSALHRTALAAFAAEPPEELDAFCPCRLVQAAAPRFRPSSMMALDENMLH